MSVLKKLPSNLSIQRSLTVTDALFYNVMPSADTPDKTTLSPVAVVRAGVRGTQNVNDGQGGVRGNVSNPQETDTAKTAPGAKAMDVSFSLATINLAYAITMCYEQSKTAVPSVLGGQFRANLDAFLAAAFTPDASGVRPIDLLARRYARNVLNGRWLWRNRTIAQTIRISVDSRTAVGAVTPLVSDTDALAVPTAHFDQPSADEIALATVLADGWAGGPSVALRVRARLDFGLTEPVEVFPSQNYLRSKETGFARSLYRVPAVFDDTQNAGDRELLGQAALRDQKVANALRTIDTWYGDFPQTGRILPVEPMGASLDEGRFFRSVQETAFTLLKKDLSDPKQIDPAGSDGQFVLAVLIRGGVFGEESDEKKEEKKKAKDAKAAAALAAAPRAVEEA